MTDTASPSPLAAQLLRHLPPSVAAQVQADVHRFTPEQLAVLHAVITTQDNLVVESTAGSGKSTVLRTIARVLPRRRPIGVFAFNASIASEINQTLPDDVLCSTLHAHGRSVLEAHSARRLELAPFKRRNIAQAYLTELGLKDAKVLRALTRLLELTLTHLTTPDGLVDVATEHELSFPPNFDIVTAIRTVQDRSLAAFQERGQIDYTDMLYLPIKLGYGAGSLGTLLIDEAQDFTRLQHRLVKHLAGPSGRVILVGDSEQAIYGFSGADVLGLERAEVLFRARRLRLTVTFRCPASHVRLAQRFSQHIQARDGAPDGEVLTTTDDALPTLTRPGDLIVCRTNGPMVQLALRLAETGQAVKILGRELDKELGAHLEATFKAPFGPDDVAPLLTARGEALLLAHARKGLTGKQLRRAVERDADQLACCAALAVRAALTAQADGRAARAEDVRRLVSALLQGNDQTAVRLCTVHKAKGMEARRVVILHPESLALGGADEREERAVCFVAYTRAKDTLILASRESL